MNRQSEPAAEWLEVGDLTPWADNPRVNDHAVGQVAKSIERFGFAAPIVARRDGDGLEVVAGHTRLKAARQLGLDRVPVRVLDLDPADARLLALADNRLGELADWSDDLGDLMQRLDDEGLDLEGLGWSDEELAALLAPEAIEAEPEPEPDLDGTPDEVPAVTQPGDVVELGRHVLHCGDCLEVMRAMPDNSIDSVVTDPPYGIGFMGKNWDCSVPGEDFAREALRVLKPGGHLIAFAATRTVHRLAVAVEDAGFELRDQIAWVQWQGFPKSHNVSIAIDAMHGAEREVIGRQKLTGTARRGVDGSSHGAARTNAADHKERLPTTINLTAPATEDAQKWEGWGTALKPAYEPAILARKPLEGTVAANVLKWGTGAINVDGCRIAYGDPAWPGPGDRPPAVTQGATDRIYGGGAGLRHEPTSFDVSDLGRWPANLYHCPKPSRGEREAGCEDLPTTGGGAYEFGQDGSLDGRAQPMVKNAHPTVKPSRIMRWLVRMVTPPGATVLEPFAGSGTTLLAAQVEGAKCIAIESEPAYCDIIRARWSGLE